MLYQFVFLCVCVWVFQHVSVSGTRGLKRLNHSQATVRREDPSVKRSHCREASSHWRPICMAPCPARGIGLFFSYRPSLLLCTLERECFHPAGLLVSEADNRAKYLGHLAGMLEGKGTWAAK